MVRRARLRACVRVAATAAGVGNAARAALAWRWRLGGAAGACHQRRRRRCARVSRAPCVCCARRCAALRGARAPRAAALAHRAHALLPFMARRAAAAARCGVCGAHHHPAAAAAPRITACVAPRGALAYRALARAHGGASSPPRAATRALRACAYNAVTPRISYDMAAAPATPAHVRRAVRAQRHSAIASPLT